MTGFFTNMFKNITNDHLELGRVLWAVAVLALIAYQGVAIWINKQDFSPTDFGIGAAGILAAGGFGVGFKETSIAKAKATEAGE